MTFIKMLLLILVGAGVVSCGAALQAERSSNGGGGTGIECVDNNCFQAKPQRVESIMNHRQILPSLTKCLAINTASMDTATTTAYNAAKKTYTDSIPTFSLDGSVKDVSAPLMMSLMTLAGEMCNVRIEVERTQATGRLFFPGFNLQTSGANNNGEMINHDKTIQALTRSCWGRDATSAEVNLIKQKISSNSSRGAALYACTAVLSSIQAIRF